VVFVSVFVTAAGVWAADGRVFHAKKLPDSFGSLKHNRDVFLADKLTATAFKEQGRRILIIGDSHAQDVFSALYLAGSTNLLYLPVQYRCQPVLGPRAIEGGGQTSTLPATQKPKAASTTSTPS
jgi:hypothetical protein